ncbi:MAG TPA: hypothetical protein VEQ66_16865 [Propionibacteriaceae bacterium]|nr:hypothetical protein [Propionibacteriaceae bacterium]
MAILMLTSTCGSPGVTALAVGLALDWPRSVLLADCDAGAHQAVLAGHLGGQSPSGKGLLRVAEAHRDGRSLLDVVVDQTLPLGGAAAQRRLFLPGFTKPGSSALFAGVWPHLLEAFARLDDAGMDVIIDAGRVPAQGLPAPMLEGATLTCLVLRSNLRSVMSARVHSAQFSEAADAGNAGLILVGEGTPYGRHEIAPALGLPVIASIPDDPRAALHLSDGGPRPRKFESTALARALHATAGTLSTRLQRTVERIKA